MMKINVKKLVDIDGNKKVQLKIENMHNSNCVPAEYRDSFPAVWLNGESLYVHSDNQERQDQYRLVTTEKPYPEPNRYHSWRSLYHMGWRCVKVEIVQIKTEKRRNHGSN